VEKIAAAFALPPLSIQRAANTLISPIFFLDTTHVIKARPATLENESSIHEEAALLEIIRSHLPFEVPYYLRSRSGALSLSEGGYLWTVHLMVPGKPIGNWYHTVEPSLAGNDIVMRTLRTIHQSTKHLDVTRWLRPHSSTVAAKRIIQREPRWLTMSDRRHIEAAIQRAEAKCTTIKQGGDSVVLHGDLHQGNILANSSGDVTGVIDWHGARGGHFCDDVGFTIMMLSRDFSSWSPTPSTKQFHELTRAYGASSTEIRLIWDFTLIWALLDAESFRRRSFPGATRYLKYQRAFCKALLDIPYQPSFP